MDILSIYKIGALSILVYALFWSFVLDRDKPDTRREFVAKLLARWLFLMFIFSVLTGFAYFAFDVFETPETLR